MKFVYEVTTLRGTKFEVQASDLASAALSAEAQTGKFNPAVGVVLNIQRSREVWQERLNQNFTASTPSIEARIKLGLEKSRPGF